MKAKKLISLLLALALCLSMAVGASAEGAAAADAADTVVYGIIYTSDDQSTRVEAMAIKDGVIVYTGDKAGAEAYIGENTEVTDYGDEFIMPGFIDGHIHIYVDAENQAGFILSTCKEQTQEAYLECIKEYIAAHPDEEIYKGFGWLDSAFIGGTPTAAMLDEICSDKPIYIKSEDCHSCWVNTKMLEMTGVTAETEDPVGGVIEHDADGNPNGCFRDTAMDYLVKPCVPAYSVEQYEEILLNAQEKMLSLGYTAYDDVIIDPQSKENICQAYYNLNQEGKLVVKINEAILINNTENYVSDLEEVVALRDKYSGGNFQITDVKIFMDGIVESETAYVSEPYADGKTGADRWPTEEDVERLNDLTLRVNDAGLVAHFHAIGDAAITKALDALEYAKENTKNTEIRNVMTHFQMISQDDIQRMADLDVIAAANLGWAPSQNEEASGSENIEELNVGEERNNAMYPFKSMLDAGVKMSYATDYPAGPVVDPLYNMEAGVTRQIFDYTSTCRNADECLTIDEALHAMTAGGAYQLGREDEIGTLEVGKSADFIVLSQDVTAIDPTTIYNTTKVEKTYVNGNLEYSRVNAFECGGFSFPVPSYYESQEEGDGAALFTATKNGVEVAGLLLSEADNPGLAEDDMKSNGEELMELVFDGDGVESVEMLDLGDYTLAGMPIIGANLTGSDTVALAFIALNTDINKILLIMYIPESSEDTYVNDFAAMLDAATLVEAEAAEDASAAADSADTSGLDPEFKATMDAYEAFFDEYVAFMEKYMENPTDLTMLTEYTSMLSEMTEMEEAMDSMDEDDMTPAELAYYLEVTARIESKLLGVMS